MRRVLKEWQIPPALAREGDQALVSAVAAAGAGESVGEDAAAEVGPEGRRDQRFERPGVLFFSQVGNGGRVGGVYGFRSSSSRRIATARSSWGS